MTRSGQEVTTCFAGARGRSRTLVLVNKKPYHFWCARNAVSVDQMKSIRDGATEIANCGSVGYAREG